MNTSARSTTIRLALAAALCTLGTTACTLEIDSDRAAARRIAERSERAIERAARDTDLDAADIGLITDAIEAVFDNAVLDDTDDLDDLDLRGVVDLDGDRLDDDGEVELIVDGAHACLIITDADSVTFDVERC